MGVCIGDNVFPWRVGHWREVSITTCEQSKLIPASSPSKVYSAASAPIIDASTSSCTKQCLSPSADTLLEEAVDTGECAATQIESGEASLKDCQDTQLDDDSQDVVFCPDS